MIDRRSSARCWSCGCVVDRVADYCHGCHKLICVDCIEAHDHKVGGVHGPESGIASPAEKELNQRPILTVDEAIVLCALRTAPARMPAVVITESGLGKDRTMHAFQELVNAGLCDLRSVKGFFRAFLTPAGANRQFEIQKVLDKYFAAHGGAQ